MEETIAFSNGLGAWVSRYSYTPSCIGWIKDQMVTAPRSTDTQDLLWIHAKDEINNNRFYGGLTTSSGLSLSFNQNPSANKIYKSFSIETPNVSALDGVNTFVTNHGITAHNTNRRATVNFLQEKGGILYGGIEGIKRISASNMNPVGVVESIEDLGQEGFRLSISGQSNQYSGGEARLVKPSLLSLFLAEEFLGYPVLETSGNGYIVSTIFQGSEGFELTPGDELILVYVDINFDQPKGQFVDVSVTFGNDNFEVHALNVDFEPTQLDHNR